MVAGVKALLGFALSVFLAALGNAGCAPSAAGDVVMAVGVSSDGRFAVTTHRDNALVLWDLQAQESKTLASDANIYSAYFVPKNDAFLWQDLKDIVRVQHVDGEVLQSFEHFPTYGHLIDTSLNHYLSADVRWNIYYGWGEEMVPVKRDGDSPSFKGSGKVINLAIDRAAQHMVSSGSGRGSRDTATSELPPPVVDGQRFSKYFEVTLWSLKSLEPIAKLPGNTSKTHATLSPDGQWVVSGDENGIGLYWNTDRPEERLRMASYFHGLFLGTHEPGDPRNRDRSGLIPAPDDATDTTVAIKFIHHGRYYLRFGYNSHYAALFEVDNPWPLKYFDLGTRPFPATDKYSRNLAIDTAPEAGVLVMGQRDGSGILVYQFDPDELTLERIWVGK
jgi:hypothetical protein